MAAHHCTQAPTGRWQKGKDLFWYTKEDAALAAANEERSREISAVKAKEEELMLQALYALPRGRRAKACHP